MLENTTVTLPLVDFDTLRREAQEYKALALALARCFDYKCTKNPYPPECEDCKTDTGCDDCEVYQNNPTYIEKLSVDVDWLINVAKEYALYNKNVETDLDAIPVERTAEHKMQINKKA